VAPRQAGPLMAASVAGFLPASERGVAALVRRLVVFFGESQHLHGADQSHRLADTLHLNQAIDMAIGIAYADRASDTAKAIVVRTKVELVHDGLVIRGMTTAGPPST